MFEELFDFLAFADDDEEELELCSGSVFFFGFLLLFFEELEVEDEFEFEFEFEESAMTMFAPLNGTHLAELILTEIFEFDGVVCCLYDIIDL